MNIAKLININNDTIPTVTSALIHWLQHYSDSK